MEGRYIARHGYAIKHNNHIVGEVTSGTLSPTLNSAIALGYLPLELTKIGQTVDVEIRGKLYPARVVKKTLLSPKIKLAVGELRYDFQFSSGIGNGNNSFSIIYLLLFNNISHLKLCWEKISRPRHYPLFILNYQFLKMMLL